MNNGMTFDAGTWWLIGFALTALLGVTGYLVVRSIFAKQDEHSADIKDVRENYTTRTKHDADIQMLREEIKDVRSEAHNEITQLSADIKELRETCLRRDDFLRSQLQTDKKLDRIQEILMERSSR